MNLKCRLGLHDWVYNKRTWYADHGACFDQGTERVCRRCDKQEHGNYFLYGPYPCSDNDTLHRTKKGETE